MIPLTLSFTIIGMQIIEVVFSPFGILYLKLVLSILPMKSLFFVDNIYLIRGISRLNSTSLILFPNPISLCSLTPFSSMRIMAHPLQLITLKTFSTIKSHTFSISNSDPMELAIPKIAFRIFKSILSLFSIINLRLKFLYSRVFLLSVWYLYLVLLYINGKKIHINYN